MLDLNNKDHWELITTKKWLEEGFIAPYKETEPELHNTLHSLAKIGLGEDDHFWYVFDEEQQMEQDPRLLQVLIEADDLNFKVNYNSNYFDNPPNTLATIHEVSKRTVHFVEEDWECAYEIVTLNVNYDHHGSPPPVYFVREFI